MGYIQVIKDDRWKSFGDSFNKAISNYFTNKQIQDSMQKYMDMRAAANPTQDEADDFLQSKYPHLWDALQGGDVNIDSPEGMDALSSQFQMTDEDQDKLFALRRYKLAKLTGENPSSTPQGKQWAQDVQSQERSFLGASADDPNSEQAIFDKYRALAEKYGIKAFESSQEEKMKKINPKSKFPKRGKPWSGGFSRGR